MDFPDALVAWSLALVLGVPLLVVLLTEAVDRLERRQHPLARPLRLARNVVLPTLAILLVLRYILGYEGTALLTRLVATLFWFTVLLVTFRVLQLLLTPSEQAPSWRDNVPALLLAVPRFLLALLILYLILARVWNINVAELITALGIGSLVIALALQDTLSNLFSGLLLLLNRPFQVGEWIRTGDAEGRVLEINWRYSLIRTRDNDLIVIPNGSIAKSQLKNYSRPTRLHRLKEEFDFHIDCPPNLVRQMLEEAALATPGVLADPPPDSRTVSYDGISIHYKIFLWVEDYGPVQRIRNRFVTSIYYHAQRYGLKWPTPERALFHYHGPTVASERAITTETRVETLKDLPVFAVLDDDAIEELAQAATVLDYGKDEQIVREGEQEQGLYVLTQGEARIAITDEAGEEQEITQLHPGDIFGEAGLFRRAISATHATALTDVELLLIPHRTMNDVINSHPRFAEEMSTLIEERKKLIRRAQPDVVAPTPVRSANGQPAS